MITARVVVLVTSVVTSAEVEVMLTMDRVEELREVCRKLAETNRVRLWQVHHSRSSNFPYRFFFKFARITVYRKVI